MARVLSHTTIVANGSAAGLGAEQLGGNTSMSCARDRNTMRDAGYRALAPLVFQGDHFVRFRATRDRMGVNVKGAEEALAFVAYMRSLDGVVVAEIAIAIFSVEILESHDVVLQSRGGDDVGSRQTAQRTLN